MVKHQRRSHQRGIHSSEFDDGETSESDSGESPTTPEHYSQIQWLQDGQHSAAPPMIPHGNGPVIHRAHTFNEFGLESVNDYGANHAYGHRQNGAQNYNDVSAVHNQSHIVVSRPPHQQHSYFVPEQGNPGVATMNTNSNGPIRHYQPGQDQIRRGKSYPPQNVPSVQSSPGTFSSGSSRSPMPQEVYYAHHPVQAPAPYAIPSQSPVDQQPMVQYQQQNAPLSQAPTQSIVSSTPLITQVPSQYQPDQQWYTNGPYQEPVQVNSAHCGDVLYNPWMVKIENYGDIQHALPSARCETL